MSIKFYVADYDTKLTSRPATITPREIASLRRLANESNAFIDDECAPDGSAIPFTFDVGLCRVSISEISAVFDHRPDVLSVIEEAIFLGRLLSIRSGDGVGIFKLFVSSVFQGPLEILVDDSTAHSVFEAFGIDPSQSMFIDLSHVADRLRSDETQRTFTERGIGHRVEYFSRAVSTARHDQFPVLVWS